MARVIAVAVPKGGTGKTTTTLNLGAALAEQGQRVLLVDFDPQGNLTQPLGLRPAQLEHTSYTAIKQFLTRFELQLDLVPTSARLNLANDELAVAIQREFVLQKLIAPLLPRYDYILIVQQWGGPAPSMIPTSPQGWRSAGAGRRSTRPLASAPTRIFRRPATRRSCVMCRIATGR